MTSRSPLLTLNNGVQIPALGLGVFQSSPEETVTAVESAIAHGYRLIDTAAAYFKVRAIGVSNFTPEHLLRLLAETSVVPAVNQIEVHPYFQQTALQRLHAEHGILTQAWSPIGGITSYLRRREERVRRPSDAQIAEIDALDAEVRRGPDPDSITLEAYGTEIPEA